MSGLIGIVIPFGNYYENFSSPNIWSNVKLRHSHPKQNRILVYPIFQKIFHPLKIIKTDNKGYRNYHK